MVLLDRALEEKISKEILEIFKTEKQVNDYHFLRTRTAGQNNFVDVHLVFDCLITLMEAHKVSDKIEEKIEKLDMNKHWIINIHLDPYDDSDINKNL